MKIKIKPMSVNVAWQGRRFKTQKYKDYWNELFYLLPNLDENYNTGKLKLKIKVGLSNKNADLDNVLKPILDILQDTYRFNDKQIYKIDAEKEDVGKGEEYIEFNIKKL